MAKKNIDLITLDARDLNTGRMMEKTEPCELTSDHYLTVPDNYYADIYIDGCLIKKLKALVFVFALGHIFPSFFAILRM